MSSYEPAESIGHIDPLMHFTSPVLKITYMLLMMAIKDRVKVLTFIRNRQKGTITIMADHKDELVPPPRHLSRYILRRLRRLGQFAFRDPETSFRFTFTEDGGQQRLDWFIDQNGEKELLAAELSKIAWLSHEEEMAKLMARADKRQREARRKFWLILAAIIGFAALGIFIYAKFH